MLLSIRAAIPVVDRKEIIMSASKFDSPSHADIAARAEQIYRESGCVEGRDLENWVQAENELKQRSESNGVVASANPNAKATTKSKAGARTQREKQRA
jgi:hypothetical protein